jgi:hypothetical protein
MPLLKVQGAEITLTALAKPGRLELANTFGVELIEIMSSLAASTIVGSTARGCHGLMLFVTAGDGLLAGMGVLVRFTIISLLTTIYLIRNDRNSCSDACAEDQRRRSERRNASSYSSRLWLSSAC